MYEISKTETGDVKDTLWTFHDGECVGPLQRLTIFAVMLILPLAGTYALAERPERGIDKRPPVVIERTKLDAKN